MYQIDHFKKPKKLSLSLAKPTRNIIDNIVDRYDEKLKFVSSGINELSFTIPIDIEFNHKLIENPLLSKIKERFLLKVKYGDEYEWHIITKKTLSGDDNSRILIQSYSLGYELNYQRIKNYTAVSYNLTDVATDCLFNTNWKIGYVDPKFNLLFRQFDESSLTKLDFLFKIGETFKAIPIFNTHNRTISFYQESDISQYKGMIITDTQYLDSIEDVVDLDEVATRLDVTGSEGLTINTVNPTGQSYLEDYSYFMYPFERDINRNVVKESDFMTNSLCHAILDYNHLINMNRDVFSNYLVSKKSKQEESTVRQTELDDLKLELQVILDQIYIAQQVGESTTVLNQTRNSKQQEINNKKSQVDVITAEIATIDININSLKNLLKEENNFTPIQLKELRDYIFIKDWSDDNYFDENDLYEASVEEMQTVNAPPINAKMNIVNFFSMITEQHNWNRFALWDIVKVKHKRLGIDIKIKIIEIDIDFNSDDMSVTISNAKRVEDINEKITKALYTISHIRKDYANRKIDWKNVATNFNNRNNRISVLPSPPIFSGTGNAITHKENDDGSIDLIVNWSFPNSSGDQYNIDGFLIYLYSSTYADSYIFGSTMTDETIVPVSYEHRVYSFKGIPANRYYTIGIRSYRTVDADIELEGVLKSAIITSTHVNENPYLPRINVEILGNVTGKLNGVTHNVTDFEPMLPEKNDTWLDLNDNFKEKVYDGLVWQPTSSGSADSLMGVFSSVENVPNTIPIRGIDSVIKGSIDGDAKTLGGNGATAFILKTEKGIINGVATLDETINVPEIQLNNAINKIPIIKFGNYIGDNIQNKEIDIGFKPTLVKVYTTDSTDFSVYINSELGGFVMKQNLSFFLEGLGVNFNEPSFTYGKLSEIGFFTGNTIDIYINKLDVTYYWEAIKLPEIEVIEEVV